MVLHLSGLLVAAGVAAALFASSSFNAATFPIAFWVALAHAVLIGLPLYLILRRHTALRWWHALIGGFVAGTLPIALLALVPAADQASTGTVPTIINGSRTVAGWQEYVGLVSGFGVLGAVGGLAFGLCVYRDLPRSVFSTAVHRRALTRLEYIIPIILGSSSVVAALGLPWLNEDHSCHNPLRGRSSLASTINASLAIEPREWPEFVKIVQDFAQSRAWSYRGDVRPTPDFQWLQISICQNGGTDFLAMHADPLPGINISVSQPQGGISWQEPFADLYNRLNARWPGRVTLTGAQGQKVVKPEWLADPSARGS